MAGRGLLGGLAGLGQGLAKAGEKTGEVLKFEYLATLQQKIKAKEREHELADREDERTNTVADTIEVIGEDGNKYNQAVNAYNKPVGDPTLKERASNALFDGTGIEAQMLNVLGDKSIPDTDPRKQFAKQWAQKPKTTVTPDGTYVTPGYDLTFLGGGGAAPAATGSSPTDRMPGFSEKPPTEGEKKNAGYFQRMLAAHGRIEELGGYDPTTAGETLLGLTNATSSPEKQQFQQAADDFIRAKLRFESGAVIGEEEMKSEYRNLFPIYGDSQEVIENKRRARAEALNAMYKAAGRAAPREWENPFQSAPSNTSGNQKFKWGDY